MSDRRGFYMSTAGKDLVVLAGGLVLTLALSYYLNIFLFIVDLFQRHPRSIVYIDEIVVGLVVLSLGFAVFSWRRWYELKRETTLRLRLQAELLRMAETKARTEEIICRQLHVELDQLKKTKPPPEK